VRRSEAQGQDLQGGEARAENPLVLARQGQPRLLQQGQAGSRDLPAAQAGTAPQARREGPPRHQQGQTLVARDAVAIEDMASTFATVRTADGTIVCERCEIPESSFGRAR